MRDYGTMKPSEIKALTLEQLADETSDLDNTVNTLHQAIGVNTNVYNYDPNEDMMRAFWTYLVAEAQELVWAIGEDPKARAAFLEWYKQWTKQNSDPGQGMTRVATAS